MLVDVRFLVYREGWLDLVEARSVGHRADVAVLNVALAAAAISVPEVSIITLLSDNDSISADVLTFQVLVGEESLVHLVAGQAVVTWLEHLARQASCAVVVERVHTGPARWVTVSALTQVVLVAVREVIPLEVLSGATLWQLAICANEEVAKLCHDAVSIEVLVVSASGALGGEGTTALGTSRVARIAVVVLIIAPEAIRA